MLISEIFSSIDGESKRAGELATFVRTVGCNLRCSFCDSVYTWQKDSTSREMTADEIVEECNRIGNHNITFTGGEPLIQKDSDELIIKLIHNGFDVSIETDGGIDFTTKDWFNNRDSIEGGSVWVCADYKCYESGMTDKMLTLDKFAQLYPEDVLKFVVGSKEDLELTKNIIDNLRSRNCSCYFYLSPVFGKIEPREIVEFMQLNNMQDKIRFQLQLHKFVWNPNKRGV